MNALLSRLDRWLLGLSRVRWPWWAWPLAMVLLAAGSLTASLLLHPGPDEFVYFSNGVRFGETCASIQLAGIPCPQCGMTRSWVYGVRLDLWRAFLYNPAGLALLGWIVVGGIIGVVRLVRRNPVALRPSWQLNVGWGVFWLIGLYAVPWLLRLLGVNPLP